MGALAGVGILGVIALLFWRSLPRHGKMHPLVGTVWEPYFAILFVSVAALGFGMIAGWAVDNFLK
jgi:hypothetical protein